MVADVGTFIFVDLLGMTMYPGYPFTGVIVRDAIQFLFIPSVFIILVIYMLVGRLAAPGHKIRIMIAVAAYLFIISGGYYKVFALLAGPYFIFLIFILGLFYFIPAHFGGAGGGHAHSGAALASGRSESSFLTGQSDVAEELYAKEIEYAEITAAIKAMQHEPAEARRGISDLYAKGHALKAEIRVLNARMNSADKARYHALKAGRKWKPF